MLTDNGGVLVRNERSVMLCACRDLYNVSGTVLRVGRLQRFLEKNMIDYCTSSLKRGWKCHLTFLVSAGGAIVPCGCKLFSFVRMKVTMTAIKIARTDGKKIKLITCQTPYPTMVRWYDTCSDLPGRDCNARGTSTRYSEYITTGCNTCTILVFLSFGYGLVTVTTP